MRTSLVGPVFDNVVGLIVSVSCFSSSTVKMLARYPIGLGFVSWWKFKLSLLVTIIRKIMHQFCIILVVKYLDNNLK